MKLLITGALGHIGSRLLRILADEKNVSEVVLVDNLMTQRYSSLFNLSQNKSYKFIEADVIGHNLSKEIERCDVVIHLAAMTDAANSINNPAEVQRNNLDATASIAHECAIGHTKLIMLSSTSVYGVQDTTVTEKSPRSVLRPQSPYAETKLKEEDLISELQVKENLHAIRCRFGTIYGTSPGMRFHTAVNKFCWQALHGQKLTVWRTAFEQKRPYLDIIDACRIIPFIINNNLFDGDIFNILSENATVKMVIDEIMKHKPNIEIEYVDNPIMNQLSYEVSNQKILSEGFMFKGSLKRGIAETMKIMSSF